MDEELDPIDVVVNYVKGQGWKVRSESLEVISYVRLGYWGAHVFVFKADYENGMLILACQIGLDLPVLGPKKKMLMYELINLVHVGHPFGRITYEADANLLIWSASLFMSESLSEDMVYRFLEQAMMEVETLYPSFQLLVARKTITVEDALFTAIPRVYGRA